MSGHAQIADALLKSLGGETVLLHMPSPAIAGDTGEQIGLSAPTFQDLELGPAVFRRVQARIGGAEKERAAEYELLISARAVEKLVGSLDYASAAVLFQQACGVMVGGELLQITSATSAEGYGSVYLYRLGLKGSAANVV